MKFILGGILIISLLVTLYFTYHAFREKHALAKTTGRILNLGFAIIFFNLITLYTGSEGLCMFAYGMYFIASDWMLYFLLLFSLKYTGNKGEEYVKHPLLILLLLADNLSILGNNFFGHMYELIPTTMYGENFYELSVLPAFYAHYAIILILVVCCLVILFYKSFTAPLFYRKKYLTIAIITVFIVGLNILSLTSAIDYSIIGYVIEAISIYYCAFVYTPQKLLPTTLFKVAQDMSVALFVMDVEGQILYKNKCAEMYLSEENPLIGLDGLSLEKWCRREYLYTKEEFTQEVHFFRQNEFMVLKIELQRIIDSHKHLQGGYFIIQDRTEELNNLKKEHWLATHDSLTNVYNKSYFCEKAARYIRRNPDEDLLIVCTDIKDFKMMNDFLGSKTADVVLVNFANILRERATKAIVFGRISSDIFGILIAKKDFDESIFTREEQRDLFAGLEKKVSFPIINYVVVYEVTDRNLPVSVMCDRARMAIATIKGDFHKRVAYYDDKLRKNALYEQELTSELPEAIARKHIKMYLQPQVSPDGTVLGAEALIRWIHPEKGPILPGDFIPVFERNGLISDVDQYIWETACKQLQEWKSIGRDDLYISVNISPRDFYFVNIYQAFNDLIAKYDINPKNLKLEITETAIVLDFKRQLELINRLRQDGFIVEMDDFGSGYSSLNLLKDLHVDILKIDMAFLKKAEDEDRSRKILQMVISLAKRLDMPVITEGVETAEQVAFLTEMGCDMFQGYYFARPMPVSEFNEKYI